jgi:peptidoglycan/LPS O-acetylase OafA/YrhL
LTRPAKRLGDISYGIYLLQGPILLLAFAPTTVRFAATTSVWGHWAIVLAAAAALVLVATPTHNLIERPGIKAGQRAYAKLKAIPR